MEPHTDDQPKPLAILNRATFVLAAAQVSQLPEDAGAEIAIAGRSNAGKSSAINKLTAQNKLARTSKTPGRTQQMVVFELSDVWRLVDLPGYGFAKVPAAMRQHWGKELGYYFKTRRSLNGLVLVMDVRHPLKPDDERLLEYSLHQGIPTHILLTKADKLSRGAAHKSLHAVEKALRDVADLVSVQLFSSLNGTGLEQAREKMIHLLRGCSPG